MEGVSVAKIAKKMQLNNFTTGINLNDHNYMMRFFLLIFHALFSVVDLSRILCF